MTRVRARGEVIRRFILQNVHDNPSNISNLAIHRFGVTRQAINQHLRHLVRDGSLREKGKTRNRTYELAPLVKWKKVYLLGADKLAEDLIWREDIKEVIGMLPEHVLDIWSYGFSEMFNNAVDHSAGSDIIVSIMKTAATTEMRIIDDGVGIFRKIQRELNLLDERHAILELSKGKLTTDPKHHTGEGIFFTSRVFDEFTILSGGVVFSHDFNEKEDWVLERQNPRDGTAVFMTLNNHTSRTTKKIFDQFTSGNDEDYGFTKTVVPVHLAQYGNDKLVSRSQAKRVMARVELFKTVILDFADVPVIGQAFADEVFRVFTREHPGIHIRPIHTNSEVRRMILRAMGNAGKPNDSTVASETS